MHLIKWLLGLALLVLIASFTALNAKSVSFHYLLGQRSIPLVVLIFLAFICGLLAMLLWIGPAWLRCRWKANSLQNHLIQREQELFLLKGPGNPPRNLP
ncbi:MAG: LapA family protein [Pseudomonadota bacterium]